MRAAEEKRSRIWEELASLGKIPRFLVLWREAVLELKPSDLVKYDEFRNLILCWESYEIVQHEE